MTGGNNLYAERDIEALDNFDGLYSKHVSAMTSEYLHSKSAIAAELGYRDMIISELIVAMQQMIECYDSADGKVWTTSSKRRALDNARAAVNKALGRNKMKLIDLLVQELPKRGGWPEGVDSIHQDHDGEIYAWTGSSCKLLFRTGIIADNCRPYGLDESIENMVTRNQYKSAIALLQKPAWNGEGVPSVGCECECHVDEGIIHCIVVGYDFDEKAVVMRNVPARKYFSIKANSGRIKPLRTESERKHEAVLESICAALEMVAQDYKRKDEAKLIYEAIAAGKIPGVKLDD